MNIVSHRFTARLLIAGALWLWVAQALAQPSYQLEKVVELSRHGVRPPAPDNRKEIEAATQRHWPLWTTRDGELTGHGYAAVVNKGRWEGEHYRQLGLLTSGCPQPQDIYVRASPLQRTRATAEALVDGAFPGCGVTVHHVADKNDPLFQTEAFAATATTPAQQLEAVTAKAGDLAARQQALQPAIQALKQAVCVSDAQCVFFDHPWQIRQSKSGHTYVAGLSALASMVETLRLGWSENLPPGQLAWGNITRAAQITAILPLLTANYDLSNDVLYTAQKRASILLDTMLKGIGQADSVPDARWLLLVAHDTNIAMVRTLMGFSWTLPGYTRGNIPPGSSLVFERWRDTTSGQRFLRVYFQAQSLDDLRRLQPIDAAHPLLREEWRQSGCRVTSVGTLCPLRTAVRTLSRHLDRQAVTQVSYAMP